jgi:amino acid permease
MNVNHYQSILLKNIVFTGMALILGVAICVVGIVVTKKLQLEKIYYFLAGALIVVFIFFAVPHLLKCSLDLRDGSYETYTGMCNSPSRDTLILYDEDQTKLLSAVSSPSGENQLYVVYSQRSKIALEVVKLD